MRKVMGRFLLLLWFLLATPTVYLIFNSGYNPAFLISFAALTWSGGVISGEIIRHFITDKVPTLE